MREKRKYQFSKSTSSKKTIRKRDISYSLPYSEFPATTGTFTGLAVSLLIGLFGAVNTHASSISVSVSGDMNLDLLASDDGMFGTSSASNISVVSTNAAGYTLTLTGDRADGRLVGTDPNGNHYFTNIGNSLTKEQFDTAANNGKWGIFPSKYNSVANTTNYYPAPTSNEPVNIDTTNVANNTPNTYTLAIAARAATGADTHTPTDTYSGTMTLAATGNAIDYDIAYADANNGMPGLTHGASTNGYAAVSDATPTREGYTFGGWCTVSVMIGESCTVKGGQVIEKGNNYELNGSGDNNVTLYAIWNPVTFADAFGDTAMNMQNMTSGICSKVAIGQEGTLTDTRGGTYRVGKMRDGRCWMLDNLALGGSSDISLTTEDSNVTETRTLPATRTDEFNVYDTTRVNTAYNDEIPSDSISQQVGGKVGTYYNYCAATAGTYCPAYDTAKDTPVKEDICPKGWRLPSSGPGGEFLALYTAYESNYNNFRTSFRLPLSGYYYSAQVYDQGSVGYWWSSTFYNGISMYRLYAGTSGILPQDAGGRYYGFSVRCVAK
ncbi:hypothetical protein IKE72_00820 [Candidatus Saccharibacteria bacterium]|nr:hypothetical protein [Candidatus Saccharibacteria bacterium]